MKRRRQEVGAALAGALLLLAAGPARGEALKLATLVPDGSVWDQALKEMGSEWSAATDGRVSLRIYPGGVAGDESDIVRKMRIGQLHAAALTIAGLGDIDEAFSVFATPLLIASYDELAYVLEVAGPGLRRRLEAKGFVFLHWGHGGWVHLFSKRPARTVADVKSLKMFAWAGDDARVQLWRRAGFQPVALASTDILTGLQTGLIEAYPTPPLAALSLQWFRETPYMTALGLAPLVGAVVVSKRSWDKISEEDRGRLLAIARRYEARLADEIPRQDGQAIEEMTRRGLEVVPAADPEAWQRAAADFVRGSRGELVPADIFDEVERALAEYRARAPEAGPPPSDPAGARP
ncbi:MAG: TRAP transporter substrate-binding protein DctP [Acidobacteriota bacterium]|nr:TRAP transporter substrate-binding protein DctP [Acidobacteriota bacterium]